MGFFHCPGGTAHVIVGAGDGPAVVVAVGARGGRKGVVYEVDPAALELGAGVERETTKSAEAYARSRPVRPLPRRLVTRPLGALADLESSAMAAEESGISHLGGVTARDPTQQTRSLSEAAALAGRAWWPPPCGRRTDF